MVRPCRIRQIKSRPKVTYYKPRGIMMNKLQEVVLKFDEVEALRLKNIENLDQKQSAKKMQVSASTFQRILSSAYKKISEALIKGKAIKFEGGAFQYKKNYCQRKNRRGQ